ncbi:MAG: polysaccharide biosynthesis protein PslG, partial [Solirubrobacteraceae bacterium]|nr:polysaccharide biosynthesis protein PslG [Solirubrobacteraceae bacterium]
FTDDVWFTTNNPGQWLQRTAVTGARVVLLEVDWVSIEPNAPPRGVDPTNPNGPQYGFAYLDARVRQFAASGMSVAFLVTDAPRWAEAPGGPAALEADGSWRPNPVAFGQAATALARRYSGSYPDPLRPGRALPRVRYYQAWGEANFDVHLAPQWVKQGGRWVSAAPALYRGLLNAFYAGIKQAHPDNLVITAGVGPYGDLPGGHRIPPAQFYRELLCLSGRRLVPQTCPNPAHFDIFASDPYEVGAPTTRAFNADDVSAPDLGKLTRIVNRAVGVGRALPRRHKRLWVTEFSYESSPPNPTAVPLAQQARWLEQAFYIFWRQHVDTVVWYLVSDAIGSYNDVYKSGVYFQNGVRKPAYEAYRFPFVLDGSTAWGISPSRGRVSVQRQQGRSWRTLFSVGASAGGTFVHRVSARQRGNFRAVVGGESSLVWHR